MIHTSQNKSKRLAAFLALFVFSGVAAAATTNTPQKMKAEEVVAKHLAAIGKPEDLAAAKSRIINGQDTARLKLSNTIREVTGPAQFASDGEKVLLAMVFNSTNYPYEKLAYDGQRLTVAGLPQGGRSPLANFLTSQEVIFKDGLIGGSLSSAWSLINFNPEKAKLSYAGTEKVNGRAVHKLKYAPRKGELRISLFFDAETFQHVRSEYEYTISARMGARPSSSVMGPQTDTGSQTMKRYKLTEDFSNFQITGKLTLPRVYKIQLVVEAQAQNLDYTIDFSQFVLDQAIAPEAFIVTSASDAP
ncbi:MAG TPA: hypothetical protein VJ023_16055 [Pyrinomonadaceae bacterium]|nr:hypothetical protein [Pyrinomonadaceae bacterium]